jgi:hypothetical protein
MGTGGLFPWVYSGRGVKLTTHLHLVPRSRMLELYFHSPIYLYGIALNLFSTGTNLLLYIIIIIISCGVGGSSRVVVAFLLLLLLRLSWKHL